MRGQLDFVQQKDLGFTSDHVIVLPLNVSNSPGGLRAAFHSGRKEAVILKEKILQIPAVQSVSLPSHSFGSGGWLQLGSFDAGSQSTRRFLMNQIDEDYLKTLGIKVKEGRNFSRTYPRDQYASVIINETFAELFDLRDPVGKTLPVPYNQFVVIGLVNDFHIQSLHQSVSPLLMTMDATPWLAIAEDVSIGDMPNPKISIRLNDFSESSLQQINSAWKEVVPDLPMQITFLDQTISRQYAAEQQMLYLLLVATILAILIAFLGLMGYTADLLHRSKKAIGIRMVVGGDKLSIYWLMFRPFFTQVIWSSVLATPIIYLVMQRWLADFAYHISISLTAPIWATIFVMSTGGGIIALQTNRLLQSNPIRSLRKE